MFVRGDRVVYGIHGVCCVLDVQTRSVDRKAVEYYVLEPIEQPGARYYIPTQNPVAVAKLRPILTKDKLDSLLSGGDTESDAWIADENQRKQHYRELINTTDVTQLIYMVRTLHRQKAALITSGRKLHMCDENFLRDAEKLLSAEISQVLNMPPEDVGQYIKSKIGDI